MRLAWSCLVFAFLPGVVSAAADDPTEVEGIVVATVLDQRITADHADELGGLILGPLLQQYVDERGIEVTDGEVETFLSVMEARKRQYRSELKAQSQALNKQLDAGSPEKHERARIEARLTVVESILESLAEAPEHTGELKASIRAMEREGARRYIRRWKINQALYRQYGGRVIFQQAGPEPIDAYREFLKEHEERGSFRILTEELEKDFWRYFVNDDMHNFYPKGEGEKFMETPWWKMEAPDSE